jgi:uncharacterized repeat protein (TIGR01451 family)
MKGMKKQLLCIFVGMLWRFQMVEAQQPHVEWASQIVGDHSFPYTVSTAPNGDVVTVGEYSGIVDLDPGLGVYPAQTGLSTEGGVIVKQDSLGNVVWVGDMQPQLGTILNVLSSTIDAAGRIYVYANLYGTIDVDLTAGGVTNISSTSNWGHFVACYGPLGYLHYVKQFPGTTYSDGSQRISVDSQGNLYVAGMFRGGGDFDPGSSVYTLTSTDVNYDDGFLLKLDVNGDFVYAKRFGGPAADYLNSMTLGPSGSVYVTGYFTDSVEVDPGVGSTWLYDNTIFGTYFCKLDANGNLIWAKQFSDSDHTQPVAITSDAIGNIAIIGFYTNSVDLDPSPTGTAAFTSSGQYKTYIVKLDSNGSYLWGRSGSDGSIPRAIDLDPQGNVYYTLYCGGQFDMDLGPGVDLITSTLVISKIDENGNYVWGAGLESVHDIRLYSLVAPGNGTVVMAGYFVNNANISPNSAPQMMLGNGTNLQGLTMRWGEGPCAATALNISSLTQLGCGSLGNATALMSNGTAPYTYQWSTNPVSTGQSVTIDSAGIYTVSATDATGCIKARAILVDAPTSQSAFDLHGTVVGGNYRQNVQQSLFLDAFNDGCVPVNGQMQLTLDNLLGYVSANPAPTSVNGQVLSWDLGTMDYATPHFSPQVTVLPAIAAPIGQQVCLNLDITPQAGDAFPANNVAIDCHGVFGPFDPNDITVSPVGACNADYVTTDQKLTYTIRFQNVGNADAINVRVQTQLSPYLDLGTIHIVASSHAPMTSVLGFGTAIDFRFDNIHLPDSTTDEAGSHGYVVFEILPQANLPVGTVLNTLAAIYFDYNDPVVTNTVTNTITNSVNSPNTAVSYVFGGLQAVVQGATYQWLDCDNGNAPIAGAIFQSFSIAGSGHYAVIVTEGACSDTSDCMAYPFVVGKPEPIVNAFSAKAYPNPNQSGLLHVQLGAEAPLLEVELRNTLGQLVSHEHVRNTDHFQLELPLQAGMYFVRLQLPSGEGTTLRVVRD